jgi:uncharacterized protein YjcR
VPRKDYAAELVLVRTGRTAEDLVRELYVERRHTQAEIAEALGVTRWQVVQWMTRYGISREDRPPVELEATA